MLIILCSPNAAIEGVSRLALMRRVTRSMVIYSTRMVSLKYQQHQSHQHTEHAPPSSPRLGRSRAACARGGPLEQQLALARVSRERCRALELRAGLVEAAELGEEVAAHARQEVVSLERRLRGQLIDEREARRRTERHPERDRAIQLHDG